MRTYTRKRPAVPQLIEGVNELCRLCLERAEGGMPIFADGSDFNATLALRIMICVGLEISHDECLPNILCLTCHNELEKYYAFRKKCEISHRKLKSHLYAFQMEKAKSELDQEGNTKPVKNDDSVDVCEEEEGELVFVVNLDNSVQISKERPGSKSLLLSEKSPTDGTVFESGKAAQNIEPVSKRKNIVPECSNAVVESNKIAPEISKTVHKSDNVVPEITKAVVESNTAPETSEAFVESNKFEVEIVPKPTSPDISNFLSAMLVELGILTHEGDGLIVNCESRVLQVEMGDGSHLTLQLEEEDECEEMIKQSDPGADEPAAPLVVKYLSYEGQSSGRLEVVDKKSKPLSRPRCVEPSRWCSQCGRTFATRASCERHARAVHARTRPHACRVCGRRFAQAEVMRRHELVHQDVRPFQCSECSKSFTQRGALVAHARSHLPPEERHLALHQCPKCPKLFLHSSGLSRHLTRHAGRVHACGSCGRLFADGSSLRRHLTNSGHKHAAPPT